jgi:cell shape-determining protein MreC
MMHPIQHSKRSFLSSNFLKKYIVLFFVVIFILIFSIFNPMLSLVGNVFSPFLKTGNFFYNSFGSIPRFFSDKNQLISENQKLSDELQKNNLNVVEFESLKYENQKLREELQIKPVGNFITSAIIAKPPQIPLDTLFLDEGINSGINNGDLVLVGNRILIGKISKVSDGNATVSLNSFAGVVSYGYISRTNEPIEVRGNGGDMEAKVPIDFDVVVGDKIITGGSVNFIIAVVGAIEVDHSSGFKNILISMPVNVLKINFVFIRQNV